MKIKSLVTTILLVCAMLHTTAQQKTFSNNKDALKFISDLCNNYWLKNTVANEISREITVYRQGNHLYFNVKNVFEEKAPNGGFTSNIVVNIITNVNLSKTREVGKLTKIEFAGGTKNIVTTAFHGNSDLNSKGEFSKKYPLPLEYANPMLRNNMYDLKAAVDFLLNDAHKKQTKRHKAHKAH